MTGAVAGSAGFSVTTACAPLLAPGSVARPWIDQRHASIREIGQISRGQGEVVGQGGGGDQTVENGESAS